MSEPATETPAEPAAPAEHDGEGSLETRVGRIESAGEQIRELLTGGGGQREEPEAPDIKAEVRAAVREVQAKDKARADKAAEEQSLKEQVANLQAKVETAPQEYKKATNAMGWNRP